MLVSYWEDYYEEHKLEAQRNEQGEVTFSTGDPYIDKWEQELAMGLEPDLLEDLPSWHRDGTKPKEEQAKTEDQEGSFKDDYSQLSG